MDLFLAGAESPSHLATLKEAGAVKVGVNVTMLSRRMKNLEGWATEDRLGGMSWVLYADSPSTPCEGALAVLAGCTAFLPEAVIGPPAWADETSRLEDLFIPTWDGADHRILRDLLERHQGVVLPDSVVSNQAAVRTAYAACGNSMLLGALTGRSQGLEPFGLVVSSGWWAVQKHGETQVWDRGKMHRYNSADKHEKRLSRQQAIQSLGVDFDAVLADDSAATSKLAIRSWLRLEQSLEDAPRSPARMGRVEVDSAVSLDMPVLGTATVLIDNVEPPGRHEVLPVIGIEHVTTTRKDLDGSEVSEETEVLSVNTKGLRRCDTCNFSLQCPGYEAAADCTYHIPVIIRSKDQLQGVLRAMVEVQTQRVLMQRFGEEITGASDPDVGREMDRLFNMVQKWKDIEDNRDTLEMTVKAKGQMGMLSRLFGSKVGSNARLLEVPMESGAVMEEMTGA